MKKYLKITLLLLIPFFAKAQEDLYYKTWSNKQADSLRIELRKTSDDTIKMYLNRCLGLHYQEVNRNSSLYFHQQQLLLARKLNMKLWQADALDQAGWCLAVLKNYPKSLEYFSEAIAILKNPDTEKGIWMINIFSKDKIPKQARLTCLGWSYNDFAQLYGAVSNPEKEIATLYEGLKISKAINNNSSVGLISSNLCDAYLQRRKLDKAMYYGKMGLTNMKISGYNTYKGYVYKLIGKIYLAKKQYKNAKSYLDSAVTASVKINSFRQLPDTYLAIAELYKQNKKLDSAIVYAHKVTSSSYSDPQKNCEAYDLLHDIYSKLSIKDSAYHYLQLSKTLGDSLYVVEKKVLNSYQNIGFVQQMKAKKKEDLLIEKTNTIKFYSLIGGLLVFAVIIFLLIRNNKNRKKANTLLQKQKDEIEIQKQTVEETLLNLKSTQSQLIQSEKMASLGELTAGIAHEIQNPLNFVNNFSEVSKELLDEMKTELDNGNNDDAKGIADDVIQNLEKINHHGKRADAIVKGMLQHSRSSSGKKEMTDLNAICDEYLRLSYHGLRAKDKSFNATIKTDFDGTIGKINIIPQDFGRVVLNLLNNAFYAVNEKKSPLTPEGGIYNPTVSIGTKKENNKLIITVTDNGNGMPQEIMDKVFQPFFTTKPTGKGTGLGLSLSYDIIKKGHGGELKVESTENEGTTFIIVLTV